MYYIVYGVLYLLSMLPLGILYLLSDFAYFIVYYVVGYRRNVVMQNLSIAFPQRSEEEKIMIAKAFYKNFCDTLIETIKFISAGKKFFKKRFEADYTVIQDVYKTGRSLQMHLGHNFNWELANLAVPHFLPYKIVAVYLPLNNRIFEKLFRHIRSRFGSHLVAATRMKEMIPHYNTQYLIVLVADQSPPGPENAYWINFFGKPTAFLKGPEKAAKRNNYAVAFCHFTKIKRGYYKGYALLATKNPQQLPDGELTRMYARYLQNVMTANPEMWLWSHRRWKLEWKEEYGEVTG
ncbi:MAG: lysophospholipid acyltransferase family protein [Chitinophagaceae bacterium]